MRAQHITCLLRRVDESPLLCYHIHIVHGRNRKCHDVNSAAAIEVNHRTPFPMQVGLRQTLLDVKGYSNQFRVPIGQETLCADTTYHSGGAFRFPLLSLTDQSIDDDAGWACSSSSKEGCVNVTGNSLPMMPNTKDRKPMCYI